MAEPPAASLPPPLPPPEPPIGLDDPGKSQVTSASANTKPLKKYRVGWKGQRRAPRALALRRGGGSIGTAYRRCAARGGHMRKDGKKRMGRSCFCLKLKLRKVCLFDQAGEANVGTLRGGARGDYPVVGRQLPPTWLDQLGSNFQNDVSQVTYCPNQKNCD